MTIRTQQLLVRLVYPLGMLSGFLATWVAIWFAVNVLRLPSPGDESVGAVVMALAAIAFFFTSVYGGAILAALLAGRWARAECPRCAQAAVGVTFVSIKRGIYRCRACGYVHPDRGETSPPSTSS